MTAESFSESQELSEAGSRRGEEADPSLNPEFEEQVVSRAAQLLNQEIIFIHNQEFEDATAHEVIFRSGQDVLRQLTAEQLVPSEIPQRLRYLWTTPLLTQDEEKPLFRFMNFLKYQASRLRGDIDARRPDPLLLKSIEENLSAAESIRNHITCANVRLVVSIARRYVEPWHTLEELVSEGNGVLMYAVERFDYSRGFRFSTYATHSIQRELYRRQQRKWLRSARETATSPELLPKLSDSGISTTPTTRLTLAQMREVRRLLITQLDEREKFVVEARYGLNTSGKPVTLKVLGQQLGISKERVRQIEYRAMDRLREVVHKWELDAHDDRS